MGYRKQINLPQSERRTLRDFAHISGASESSVGREWIENFLANGSDYKPDPDDKVQIIIDRETAEAAERKAREEYGVGLREIIRFEIAEIAKL